ncbi:hypothetical protein QJQ45_030431, partial [Haematococcus lacustris]
HVKTAGSGHLVVVALQVNEVKFYESLVQELQQELQEVKREAEDTASQSALMMQDAEQSFLGRQMGLEEKLRREQELAGMQRSIAAWEVLAEEACSKAAAAEDEEQQLTQRLIAQERQIKDLSSLVAMKDAALADVIAQKSSLAVSSPPTQLQQLAQLEGQLADQQCEVEQLQARWRQSQEEHDSRVSELTACIAALREDRQDLEARLTTSQAETEILQQHAAGLRAAAELAGQERCRLEQQVELCSSTFIVHARQVAVYFATMCPYITLSTHVCLCVAEQVAAQQLTLDHINTAITETKAHLQATLEQLAGREAATAQATEAALEQQRQGEQLSATLQRRCGQLEVLRRQKEEVEEQLERQRAEMHMLRQQVKLFTSTSGYHHNNSSSSTCHLRGGGFMAQSGCLTPTREVALLHHRHTASTREASAQAEVVMEQQQKPQARRQAGPRQVIAQLVVLTATAAVAASRTPAIRQGARSVLRAAATQPAASEPGPSTPPPAKRSKPAAEPTKGRGKGKAAKAKPAPQPGSRIGESKWRPLELCYWPDQGALPAKGKEYPGLGYKRLRDQPPKAQQQQQQPAEAQ